VFLSDDAAFRDLRHTLRRRRWLQSHTPVDAAATIAAATFFFFASRQPIAIVLHYFRRFDFRRQSFSARR